MIAAAFVLAIISAVLEIQIVRNVPLVKTVLMKHRFLPIIASTVLSIFVGGLFGAAGLIVMLAGLGSTLMTQPYYFFQRPSVLEKINTVLHPTAAVKASTANRAKKYRSMITGR